MSSWKSFSITRSSVQDSTASTGPRPGPPTLFRKEDKVEISIKNSNVSQSSILLHSISSTKVSIKNNHPFLGYEDTLLANTAYILFILFEWNKQKYTTSIKKDQCHKMYFEKKTCSHDHNKPHLFTMLTHPPFLETLHYTYWTIWCTGSNFVSCCIPANFKNSTCSPIAVN